MDHEPVYNFVRTGAGNHETHPPCIPSPDLSHSLFPSHPLKNISIHHSLTCLWKKLIFSWIIKQISVTSHKRDGISNHWQFDCLFNTLLTMAAKKTTHYWLFVRESTSHQWISSQGPLMQEACPCHDVIMIKDATNGLPGILRSKWPIKDQDCEFINFSWITLFDIRVN